MGGQELLDTSRLQQVESAFETPQVPLQVDAQPSSLGNPLSARSGNTGGSDDTRASTASKSDLLSRATTSLPVTRRGSTSTFVDDNEREKMREVVQIRFKELDSRKVGQLNAENLRLCVQMRHGESEQELDGRIANA